MCLCARVRESGGGGRGASDTGEVGKGEGWVRDKPKAGKQSEEEEKSLPSRAYASVDGSIRSSSPSRDRGSALTLSPCHSRSLVRCAKDRLSLNLRIDGARFQRSDY